jgi:hypothetical protein
MALILGPVRARALTVHTLKVWNFGGIVEVWRKLSRTGAFYGNMEILLEDPGAPCRLARASLILLLDNLIVSKDSSVTPFCHSLLV